ncbi:CaiB/BaiF CoA transferase family protein [Kutzneria sp. CA-103260]|uniref:CaiB/BaiF CoA transferase family protein n=1 Tax=Kutzneria sp. CA-103260 TaxID=2802641 RepID=UPI001BAB3CAA|nr:CoA transferase [Kutzneria sp. CA-103260]QUQ66837.1 fatty acid-CoA racemase [Kutzneria sp. CA-103260]
MGALDGIRVIDLATVVMGPYATQILGDMGADVIKVEPPTGDMSRLTAPYRNEGMGSLALNVNRNKRAVCIDLKNPRGKQVFLDLVKTADVVVTNMRPGALHRLGLDYEQLAEVNPGLIYCNAQGFRSDSTLADRAAYDEIVQAASGTADLMRRATGTPTYMPTILGDKVSGLTIVYSVLAALVHKQRTGEGQRVEVPMTDTMLAFNLVEHLAGRTFEPAAGLMGFSRSLSPGHRAVQTRDGWACILPYSKRNIEDFFTEVGHPEALADPRFQDSASLAANFDAFYDLIEKYAGERTTAEWEATCARLSIPFAPVLDLDDVTEDPYVNEVGLLETAEHPTEGTYRVIGSPVRFSATPASVRRHAPRLGQDNDEVLGELGYSADELRELAEAGVTARR